MDRLQSELTGLKERESRLVHLDTLREVREVTLGNESVGIGGQRLVSEERLGPLRRKALPLVGNLDPERLNSICAAVASWLERADEPEKALVLDAPQIGVTATVNETRISGVLYRVIFIPRRRNRLGILRPHESSLPFGRAFLLGQSWLWLRFFSVVYGP